MCCQVILESSINQRGSCDGSLWSVKFSLGETTILNPRRLAQPSLLLRKCQTNRQTDKIQPSQTVPVLVPVHYLSP